MTSETIECMRYQEDTWYVKADYLSEKVRGASSSCLTSDPCHPFDHVRSEDRRRMIAWCYELFDRYQFNLENVEIAVSYLDRFMCKVIFVDRSTFQLITLACIYIALKIHDTKAMHPITLSNLSRGIFSPKQICSMEQYILQTLQWHVNPPTSLEFVRQYIQLLDEHNILKLNHHDKHALYDMTCIQTELILQDSKFITLRPSYVAYCALMNSLEIMRLRHAKLVSIGLALANIIDIDCNELKLREVKHYLFTTVMKGEKQPSDISDMSTVQQQVTATCSDPKQQQNSQSNVIVDSIAATVSTDERTTIKNDEIDQCEQVSPRGPCITSL